MIQKPNYAEARPRLLDLCSCEGGAASGRGDREGSTSVAQPDDGHTPLERAWLAEDPSDPRPDCPNREQHAYRLYGDRWQEGRAERNRDVWPKLDGRSVKKTHQQTVCVGCGRYMIWLPKAAAGRRTDA